MLLIAQTAAEGRAFKRKVLSTCVLLHEKQQTAEGAQQGLTRTYLVLTNNSATLPALEAFSASMV